MEQKILMFDAEVQHVAEHTITIDGNGEVILTSVESGRFVKLPATTTAEELSAYIAAHKEENAGQISQASIDAKRDELLTGLLQVSPQDVVTVDEASATSTDTGATV